MVAKKEQTTKKSSAPKVEKKAVSSKFDAWWDDVAANMVRQGHSDKNVMIAALGKASYTDWVQSGALAKAIDENGRELKEVCKAAFNFSK